jgi:hypothetical protein
MTTPSSTSRWLRAVARVFFAFGLLAVLEIAVKLALGSYCLTTGVLGVPIYFGLMRHSGGWRSCALIFLWWGFLTLPLIAVLSLLGSAPSYFDLFGVRLTRTPGWAVAAGCVPFFLINLWQYRVLVNPSVRRLFVQERHGLPPNSAQQPTGAAK